MTLCFGSSAIEFLSRTDGMRKISSSDEYTRNLSKFDRMAKIRTLDPGVGERQYLDNCRSYVREWMDDEIEYISTAIREADQRLSDYKFLVTLPESISIVATTGWEEGGARGYTRADAIYLNHRKLSKELVFHELFHIISRFNEEKRDGMYDTLRFKKCNQIRYAEDLRITNPDAPSLCHVVRFNHQNNETFGAIIMRASKDYEGGGFFSYVNKKLLVVEERCGEFVPKSVDGEFVFLDFAEASRLYDSIGRNTSYNIHQEEICAEHFVAIMTAETELPDQHLVSDMLGVLQA